MPSQTADSLFHLVTKLLTSLGLPGRSVRQIRMTPLRCSLPVYRIVTPALSFCGISAGETEVTTGRGGIVRTWTGSGPAEFEISTVRPWWISATRK